METKQGSDRSPQAIRIADLNFEKAPPLKIGKTFRSINAVAEELGITRAAVSKAFQRQGDRCVIRGVTLEKVYRGKKPRPEQPWDILFKAGSVLFGCPLRITRVWAKQLSRGGKHPEVGQRFAGVEPLAGFLRVNPDRVAQRLFDHLLLRELRAEFAGIEFEVTDTKWLRAQPVFEGLLRLVEPAVTGDVKQYTEKLTPPAPFPSAKPSLTTT